MSYQVVPRVSLDEQLASQLDCLDFCGNAIAEAACLMSPMEKAALARDLRRVLGYVCALTLTVRGDDQGEGG